MLLRLRLVRAGRVEEQDPLVGIRFEWKGDPPAAYHREIPSILIYTLC